MGVFVRKLEKIWKLGNYHSMILEFVAFLSEQGRKAQVQIYFIINEGLMRPTMHWPRAANFHGQISKRERKHLGTFHLQCSYYEDKIK